MFLTLRVFPIRTPVPAPARIETVFLIFISITFYLINFQKKPSNRTANRLIIQQLQLFLQRELLQLLLQVLLLREQLQLLRCKLLRVC